MKLSIQLAQLCGDAHARGLIQSIARHTDLERHTVSDLLKNRAKYISLEALGRLCDYLVAEHGVDPSTLPGALFAREPESFWEMFSNCGRLEFCLGKRTISDAPLRDRDYVMASDAHLHGVLAARMTRFSEERPRGGEGGVRARPIHELPDPHRVAAPSVRGPVDLSHPEMRASFQHAAQIHAAHLASGEDSCLIALGTTKINPLVEILFAELFGCEPGVSDDGAASAEARKCPVIFLYREHDTQPSSCCGGVRLAADQPAEHPGIHYEGENGKWHCLPCVEQGKTFQDAAFVLYAQRPHQAKVELACGGFSGVATSLLATRIDSLGSRLGDPQFESPTLRVGLFLISFRYATVAEGKTLRVDAGSVRYEVVRVNEASVVRRVAETVR